MSKRKHIINAVGLVVLIIVFIAFSKHVMNVSLTGRNRVMTSAFIIGYIEKNDGRFPASEDELIEKGGLRKQVSDTETKYYYILKDGDGHKNKLDDFGSFKLRYGSSLENVEMENGRLYDKLTHEEVLLIDGLYTEQLKDRYRDMSCHWYKLMVEMSKDSQGL